MKIISSIIILLILIFIVYSLSSRLNDSAKIKPQDTNGRVELLKPFTISENSDPIFYQNASFKLSSTTLPFSRNPVTGIEQFPVTSYKIDIQYYGAIPTVGRDGKNIEPVVEANLHFHNNNDTQEFEITNETYTLQLLGITGNQAKFVLTKNPSLDDKPDSSTTSKATVTKDFTSNDDSFTFSYPEFENWISGQVQIQYIKSPTPDELLRSTIVYYPKPSMIWSGPTPEIQITKIYKARKSLMGENNPMGVVYNNTNQPTKKVIFQSPSFEVTIEIYPSDISGFSSKAVIDEIIKTFKLKDGDLISESKK